MTCWWLCECLMWISVISSSSWVFTCSESNKQTSIGLSGDWIFFHAVPRGAQFAEQGYIMHLEPHFSFPCHFLQPLFATFANEMLKAQPGPSSLWGPIQAKALMRLACSSTQFSSNICNSLLTCCQRPSGFFFVFCYKKKNRISYFHNFNHTFNCN